LNTSFLGTTKGKIFVVKFRLVGGCGCFWLWLWGKVIKLKITVAGNHREREKGRSATMACSANHSKGSGSAVGAGLIMGQPGWLQRKIHLRPQHRGVHLVTEEILRQVSIYIYLEICW